MSGSLPSTTASLYRVQKTLQEHGSAVQWHDNVGTPTGLRPALLVDDTACLFSFPKSVTPVFRITGQKRVGLSTKQVAFYAQQSHVVLVFHVQAPHELVFVAAQALRDNKQNGYLPDGRGGEELTAFIDRKDCVVYPVDGSDAERADAYRALSRFGIGVRS